MFCSNLSELFAKIEIKLASEQGATYTEYVLLAMLVAVLALPAIGFFGSKTNSRYENINTRWEEEVIWHGAPGCGPNSPPDCGS